jgi:glycosyltransferase involved in cell wall biosynthesis
MIVSVICPCRNEVGHIDTFLRAVTRQQATEFDLEILVADGESDDGTAEELAAWRAREPRIAIVPNPGRIVSTGLNAAIRIARGEIIVRMDVHTEYADDYVAQCVETLKQSRAMCVGGPWLAKGSSLRQGAIAAAFGSIFGSGSARSRRTDYTGSVDTVYLGAWWRTDLIALGGFDEGLVRNQDDELCLRITRSGGTVWQSGVIRSSYVPRDTLRALWRQFYQYGYWKAAVIRKHRLPASIRQVAPTLFIALLLALSLIALFAPLARLLVAGLLITYVVAAAFAAFAATESHRPASVILVVLSFACMHFGYGLGLGHGVLDFHILRRKAAPGMSELSR